MNGSHPPTKTVGVFIIYNLSMNKSNLLRLQKAKTKEASWIDMSIRLKDLEYLIGTLLLDSEYILREQLEDTLTEALKDFNNE